MANVIVTDQKELCRLIDQLIREAFSAEIAMHRLKVGESAQMLIPAQVRDYVHCSNQRVYDALKSGALPFVDASKTPRGTRKLIRLADAEAWAAAGAPVEIEVQS